jgi:hypothetical protein
MTRLRPPLSVFSVVPQLKPYCGQTVPTHLFRTASLLLRAADGGVGRATYAVQLVIITVIENDSPRIGVSVEP